MKFLLPIMLISLLFIGCATKKKVKPIVKTIDTPIVVSNTAKLYTTQSLDTAIIDIADQLFDSNPDSNATIRVILTSFVDLNDFDKTSTFGRLLSESMFNELHIRHFKVTDFRGQDAVSVNEDGEFHITRDVNKLKDSLASIEYILVGTYVKFENHSILINSRIIDSISGDVLSSSRVIYKPKDCKLFGLCQNKYTVTKKAIITTYKPNIKVDNGFDIVSDDCRDGKCNK